MNESKIYNIANLNPKDLILQNSDENTYIGAN
jgi:hypothetical protein